MESFKLMNYLWHLCSKCSDSGGSILGAWALISTKTGSCAFWPEPVRKSKTEIGSVIEDISIYFLIYKIIELICYIYIMLQSSRRKFLK